VLGSLVNFGLDMESESPLNMNKMKYGVINCENSQAWEPTSFADMFIALLRDESRVENQTEIWDVYNIATEANFAGDKYSFPDLSSYNVLIITGSHFNVRDGSVLVWFEPLCQLLRDAAQAGYPRVYGGCYGCQVIGHALGGDVDYNPDKKFILKAEVLNPMYTDFKEFFSLDQEYDESFLISGFKVLESHGDCVKTLPPGATLLASSHSCNNEIFVCGAHRNLLACQSHPEFDLDYAIHERIWKSVVVKNKRLTEEEAQYSMSSFEGFSRQSGPDFLIFCLKRFFGKR